MKEKEKKKLNGEKYTRPDVCKKIHVVPWLLKQISTEQDKVGCLPGAP